MRYSLTAEEDLYKRVKRAADVADVRMSALIEAALRRIDDVVVGLDLNDVRGVQEALKKFL